MYLLDDPLSAVDAHVGKEIFEEGIMKALVKRDKAVVLATNQLQFLSYATKIILLGRNGKPKFSGTYAQLQNHGGIQTMVMAASVRLSGPGGSGSNSEKQVPPSIEQSLKATFDDQAAVEGGANTSRSKRATLFPERPGFRSHR